MTTHDQARNLAQRSVAVLLALLVALAASVALAPPASAGTVEDEGRLFQLHNQARAAAGLAPFAYDSAAVGIARGWAEEMARTGNLRHNPNLVNAVNTYVTSSWTRLGENVGFAGGPDQVHNAFMGSAAHRANILGDYNRVGIGTARDGSGRLWVTAVFIKGPALDVGPVLTGLLDIVGSVHRANIQAAVDAGLMKGTSATAFSPTLPVSRGQLASLVRNVLATRGVTAANAPNAFADDNGSVHEPNINSLAALRVIGGNGEAGSSYFPTRDASRSTVASYLGRAYVRITGRALPTSPDAFTDDERDPAEAEINGLAALGVIGGKGGGVFDPNGSVNRAQVATMVMQLVGVLS